MKQKHEKTAKDSHYARLRRQHRDRQSHQRAYQGASQGAYRKSMSEERQTVRLYGLHTVAAALANPKRQILRLLVTKNAYSRLNLDKLILPVTAEFCQPRQLDQLLGSEAVHQGVMLETAPLKPRSLDELGDHRLVVVLDQLSDPHNVGALMRSSVAFNVGALITTARHSPQESGVLAKAASGALEMLDYVSVVNLAQALQKLHELGFTTIGLDSEANEPLEQAMMGEKIALVLGAEGRGLRLKTRETVTRLARFDMPGAIKSLNVSNAGVLALYVAHQHLQATVSACENP